ncbi:hypothetical protein [Rosistilla oblonga]|uniref:hypothetical protein n=1 Tax=Rosistilla oblonga TaxID=2527990 RepID=UPI003A973CFF
MKTEIVSESVQALVWSRELAATCFGRDIEKGDWIISTRSWVATIWQVESSSLEMMDTVWRCEIKKVATRPELDVWDGESWFEVAEWAS